MIQFEKNKEAKDATSLKKAKKKFKNTVSVDEMGLLIKQS